MTDTVLIESPGQRIAAPTHLRGAPCQPVELAATLSALATDCWRSVARRVQQGQHDAWQWEHTAIGARPVQRRRAGSAGAVGAAAGWRGRRAAGGQGGGMSDRTLTHPGGIIDEAALQRGWRLGVADAWRAALIATGQPDEAIQRLGNGGPPPDLTERAKR